MRSRVQAEQRRSKATVRSIYNYNTPLRHWASECFLAAPSAELRIADVCRRVCVASEARAAARGATTKTYMQQSATSALQQIFVASAEGAAARGATARCIVGQCCTYRMRRRSNQCIAYLCCTLHVVPACFTSSVACFIFYVARLHGCGREAFSERTGLCRSSGCARRWRRGRLLRRGAHPVRACLRREGLGPPAAYRRALRVAHSLPLDRQTRSSDGGGFRWTLRFALAVLAHSVGSTAQHSTAALARSSAQSVCVHYI